MKVSCSLDDTVLPWKPLRHQRKQLQTRFRAQQAVAEMAWWLAPSLATTLRQKVARHSRRMTASPPGRRGTPPAEWTTRKAFASRGAQQE